MHCCIVLQCERIAVVLKYYEINVKSARYGFGSRNRRLRRGWGFRGAWNANVPKT